MTGNIEDIYPLSPMQQGMLFHSLYAPGSAVYCEQTVYGLNGMLDVAAFESAWRRVVERHPILRTAFVWEDVDEPLQVVERRVELPIEHLDWRGLSQVEQETHMDAWMAADRDKGFDFAVPPLLRLALIRTSDTAYSFVWSHHHLLIDGWSVPLLLQEVLGFYNSFHKGRALYLPSPRPYRDYIAWLKQQDMAKAEAFWRETLKGFISPTSMGVDRVLPEGDQEEGGFFQEDIHLSAEVTASLNQLARHNGLTVNTIVQGAWAFLLSRYSGERDVVFGATASGRPTELAEADSMVGLFINTLPVRVDVDPEMGVLPWLRRLQEQQAELRQYEYTPLFEIQRWSDVPGGTPLFESIVVFENYPVDSSQLRWDGDVQISETRSFGLTNYPLNVVAVPGEMLQLKLLYNSNRFERSSIERMAGHLITVLSAIAADPDQLLSTVPLLTEAERNMMFVDWNRTEVDFPRDVCIHQLFEGQVDRNPENVALSFEGEQVTYGELNARANQLGRYLRKRGIGPEILVGICLERSIEMVVAILGIWKAGGAYVPLDPNYPQERLSHMVSDAQLQVVLTQKSLLDRLPADSAHSILLDADWASIALEENGSLRCDTSPANLAYVIYTSGSTGLPKGVLLNHRGVCNLSVVLSVNFGVEPDSRVLQFASMSFDASVFEFVMALASGGTLCLARQEVLASPSDLLNLMVSERISVATFPPALLRALPHCELPDLHTIISAGDACAKDIVQRWAPGRCFWNGYGPTEVTVAASSGRCHENDQWEPYIGRPIANTQIYILNEDRQPVPIGVPGELYIGGVGVARGYLNRPELTAEKFIPNPFADDPSSRLYKTGDLARYRPNGEIEFLGRVDHQVKIRGFRIELGEIEAALNLHSSIHEAVVVVRDDSAGEKRLVAYIQCNGYGTPNIDELRTYLRRRLPDYMIPSVFVELDVLPTTPNGKVDRKALPSPDGGYLALQGEYVPPRGPIEEVLASIWSQVLGIERIGVHDNFFSLGGHSLLATQLISRVRDAFAIELPLRSLFDAPTVEGLAARVVVALQGDGVAATRPIEPILHSGPAPLSFAQQRLWFLDQLAPNSPMYNIPTVVKFTGQLDVAALQSSLAEVVRRHESLRTTFGSLDGRPVQVVEPILSVPIIVKDLAHLDAEEREREFRRFARESAQAPFDLAKGPLLRVAVLKMSEEENIFVLTVHHIVSDGWSLGVFIREVIALYQASRAGQSSPLPDLSLRYADFASWQREWLRGDVLEEQLSYWRQQLANCPPLIELPTDRPRPAIQSSNGSHRTFFLPPMVSDGLKELSRREGVTLFMTMLGAWSVLLHRYSGTDDIAVGSPIANRTRKELEPLIGFFVNTLVLRQDLSGDPSFRELLRRVREVTLGAYAHQELPFETLVEVLQPQRDLSHTPLFQVMFVFQNNPIPTVQLPGLDITLLDIESGTTSFDLTLELQETNEGLGGCIEYNTDLFDQATIERMIGHFTTLLEGILADSDSPISKLSILTELERQQLLVDWNSTRSDYPDNVGIHHLFESQVESNGAATAVVFEDQRLTYAELNRRANQLGRYLQRLGVGPEVVVGICVERSVDMVVGILGVLKAGGAYLPLDPAYPPERLAFMLSDSQTPLLLSQSHIVGSLPVGAARVVLLDTEWNHISEGSDENLEVSVLPDNLAYIIYTSGSTGKPKGTLLRHRGLCNLAKAQVQAFGVGVGANVLQFAPFSFDASVWETFMALASGGTLCLARQEVFVSGSDVLDYLRKQKISIVTMPPSVLNAMPSDDLPHLTTVVAAGESCPQQVVARWAPGRRFFNAYGPTETTVCASMALCDPNDARDPSIGWALPNFQLYILDRQMQLLPVGVPGELCVGGIGLARGYLNRPELTAEKFVPNPFSDDPTSRLYRTGDLVRCLPNGQIEFIGRIDNQVKVRGFRIELGEIESALAQHPALREVVIVAREDAGRDRRLVAYLISAVESAPSVSELRAFLRGRLPEYMVPSHFVFLETLPLTPNGKVDRRALPAPDGSRAQAEVEYVAPRTPAEITLAAIFAELLGVQQVGVYDNFFDLGGHSLLATQLVSRLRDAFDGEIPLRVIFENPTVAGLSEAIEMPSADLPQVNAPPIVPVSRDARRVRRSAIMSGGEQSYPGAEDVIAARTVE